METELTTKKFKELKTKKLELTKTNFDKLKMVLKQTGLYNNKDILANL